VYTIYLNPWEVHEFSWGTAVKHLPSQKWTNVILSPYGQEINVEHLNVILHDNGIEFY
jgi:hypothetical protein